MLSVMCCGCQRLLSNRRGTLIGEPVTDGGTFDNCPTHVADLKCRPSAKTEEAWQSY